jgi:hypothetical protein
MKCSQLVWAVTLFPLATLAGACGGDDESGFKTGVDTSKRIDQLSESETNQLCEDIYDWGVSLAKDFSPKLCKLSGLFETTREACEAAVTDCLKEPVEADDGDMCMPLENCTATAAQVQRCLDDSIKVLGAYLDKFPSCAQLANGTGSVPASEPNEPASCKALETSCPDFGSIFGDELEASGDN